MFELALIYVHGLLAAASIGIVSFFYSEIALDNGLGPIAGNMIISMFSLCGAIGGVAAGSYLTRIDPYRALGAGSVVLAISSLASAASWGGPLFVASRVLASLAFIIMVTIVPIIFAGYGERHRVFGLALWGAYLPLGIALGNGMSALALRAWDLSWRGTLVAHGAMMVLLAAAGQLGARGAGRGCDPGAATGPVGSAWSRVRRLGGASFAYAAGFGAFTTVFLIAAGILPRTLVELGGVSSSDAGVTASLVLALGALGSLAAIYVLPRIGSPRVLFAIGFAGSALGSFGLYALARTPAAVAGFAVAIIVISSLIPAGVFAYLPSVVDRRDDLGVINGLLTQVGCLGSFAGPPLLAWWIQRFGYATGWVPLAAICAAGFALFMPSLHRLSVRSSL